MARRINRWSKAKMARKGPSARFRKMRSTSGAFVVSHASTGGSMARRQGGGSGHAIIVKSAGRGGGAELSRQPEPRIPLLSGGKDPTLAERFEEELFAS